MCQHQLTKSNFSSSCCCWRMKTVGCPWAQTSLRACLIASTFSGPSPHKRMPHCDSSQIVLGGGMTTTQTETHQCLKSWSVVRLRHGQIMRQWAPGYWHVKSPPGEHELSDSEVLFVVILRVTFLSLRSAHTSKHRCTIESTHLSRARFKADFTLTHMSQLPHGL